MEDILTIIPITKRQLILEEAYDVIENNLELNSLDAIFDNSVTLKMLENYRNNGFVITENKNVFLDYFPELKCHDFLAKGKSALKVINYAIQYNINTLDNKATFEYANIMKKLNLSNYVTKYLDILIVEIPLNASEFVVNVNNETKEFELEFRIEEDSMPRFVHLKTDNELQIIGKFSELWKNNQIIWEDILQNKNYFYNEFGDFVKKAKLNCQAYYQKHKSTFEISDKFKTLPEDFLLLKIGEKSNVFDRFIEFENEGIINDNA